MKTTKRVGKINPCGTPSLTWMVWLELLSSLTVAALYHRKLLIQLNIRSATFVSDSFRRRPFHILLNALDKSIKVTKIFIVSRNAFSIDRARHMSWSSVSMFFLKTVCSLATKLLVSRCHMNLLLTMHSRVLPRQLSNLMGL